MDYDHFEADMAIMCTLQNNERLSQVTNNPAFQQSPKLEFMNQHA